MRLPALFIFLVTVAVTGCSGISVSQDYDQATDFAALKTYAWKKNPNTRQDDESELSPLVATRIRNAIDKELKAKGISFVEKSPDFLIDYNLKVESKVSSSNVSTSIGFGSFGYGHYSAIGISSAPDIREEDEGTLFIDFYTFENNKLVWRGISSQVIDKLEAPARVTEQVNLNVQKILEQFPPKVSGAR